METIYAGILTAERTLAIVHRPGLLDRSGYRHKYRLMISRPTLNKLIIIGFMVLVGFSLAKAIYSRSFMGVTLALVSLASAIYFLYILAKAKEEMEAEEAT
jgi:Na+/H+ antiporter NhaD/arsenite permease-like protein